MKFDSITILPFDSFDKFYKKFCKKIQNGEKPKELQKKLNNRISDCISKAKDIYWRETDILIRKRMPVLWKDQIQKWMNRINNNSFTNPYKETFEEGFNSFYYHINEECENCMNEDVKEKIQERKKNPFTYSNGKSKNLKKLYHELLKEKFIGVINYDNFKSHFVNQDNTLPSIQWLKPLNQLQYFVNKLEQDKIFSGKGKWIFTVSVFQHNGNPIKITQLRHTKLKDDNSQKSIDDIVETSSRID